MATENSTKSLGNLAINWKKVFAQCVAHWWWFAISVCVFVGLAFSYTKIKNQYFLTTSSILVADDASVKKSGVLSLAKSFDLGGALGGTSSVYNEMSVLGSYSVMRSTVKDLGLNEIYEGRKYLIKKIPYSPENTPVRVSCAPEIPDTLFSAIVFKVKVGKDGLASVTAKVGKKNIADVEGKQLPVDLHTTWGDFTLEPTAYLPKGKNTNLTITYLGYGTAAELYQKLITAAMPNRKSDLLTLSYVTTSPFFGVKVLDDVIKNYNLTGINQQRTTSNRTLRFLNQSLDSLTANLTTLEIQLEGYKRSLKVADVEASAKFAIARQQGLKETLIQAETEMDVMRLVKSFITNPENNNSLIPAVSGGPEADAIAAYNQTVLERMKLESTAKQSNAALRLIDEQLATMRAHINSSVDKAMQTAQLRLNELRQQAGQANAVIGEMPATEREYIAMKRRQEVEEQLYLYLLKQQHETSMSLANVQPRGVVIDAPHVITEPLGISNRNALLIAFFFGMLLPFGFFTIKDRIRNTSEAASANA